MRPKQLDVSIGPALRDIIGVFKLEVVLVRSLFKQCHRVLADLKQPSLSRGSLIVFYEIALGGHPIVETSQNSPGSPPQQFDLVWAKRFKEAVADLKEESKAQGCKERPFAWPRALDALKATKKAWNRLV